MSRSQAKRVSAEKQLQPGDRIFLKGDHPWSGSAGTLVSEGPYGARSAGLYGWLIQLDRGSRCYAQPQDIVKAT